MFSYQGAYPSYIGGPNIIAPPQGIFEESSVQKAVLGTTIVCDLRKFVYCKAGAAITGGQLIVMPDMVANHINIACVAGSRDVGIAGKRKVQVTLGATLATKNQYQDGYLHFTDNGEEGRTHMIKSHPAAESAAALILNLYDALLATVAATHEVHLEANPFLGVVTSTTGNDELPVGISQLDITDNYFFWAQYWGPCAVLAETEVGTKGTVVVPGDVAGSLKIVETAYTQPVVARVRVLSVDTEYSPVFLTIPIL